MSIEDKIKDLELNILNLLQDFISENEIEIETKVNENTRLIGSSSIFDSFDLVRFVVEVEEFLDEKYGIEIQLASEKAMSRRKSPFISIKTLSNFILEETNE
jgi:acyl carrier protein